MYTGDSKESDIKKGGCLKSLGLSGHPSVEGQAPDMTMKKDSSFACIYYYGLVIPDLTADRRLSRNEILLTFSQNVRRYFLE